MVTPLRHQQVLIREEIQHLGAGTAAVEVDTVDKYQGRDKECIIVSFVRSNQRGHVSCELSVCSCKLCELIKGSCVCFLCSYRLESCSRTGGGSMWPSQELGTSYF